MPSCSGSAPTRSAPPARSSSTRCALRWRGRDCRAGAVQLVESAAHSAGHALFSDRRLALAVARGSGAAVAQLGAVASQAGIPVSLHGTGGAWIMAGESCDADALAAAVVHSLDRKVCNTLNCLVIPTSGSRSTRSGRGGRAAPGRRCPSDQPAAPRGGGQRATGARRTVRHHGDDRSGGRRERRTDGVVAGRVGSRGRVGVGEQPGDHPRRRRRTRRRHRAVQPSQPALRRLARQRGSDRARAVLRVGRRPVRRRRLHPLGRRAVRTRQARVGPLELAGRTHARPWRDPLRRQRAHRALPGHGHRHRRRVADSMRYRAGVVVALVGSVLVACAGSSPAADTTRSSPPAAAADSPAATTATTHRYVHDDDHDPDHGTTTTNDHDHDDHGCLVRCGHRVSASATHCSPSSARPMSTSSRTTCAWTFRPGRNRSTPR